MVKSLEKTNNIDIVPLTHLERLTQKIRKDNPNVEDINISFEFLIASCFPNVWNNIQEKLRDEHMKGYLEALGKLTEEEN